MYISDQQHVQRVVREAIEAEAANRQRADEALSLQLVEALNRIEALERQVEALRNE